MQTLRIKLFGQYTFLDEKIYQAGNQTQIARKWVPKKKSFCLLSIVFISTRTFLIVYQINFFFLLYLCFFSRSSNLPIMPYSDPHTTGKTIIAITGKSKILLFSFINFLNIWYTHNRWVAKIYVTYRVRCQNNL